MKKALSTALLCFSVATQLFAQQFQWTTKAPMITPRLSMACAALNDTIYAFGGHTGANVVGTSEAFNVKTNTWRSIATMPTARVEMAAEQVGGKLYVIGGYNDLLGGGLNTVEIYDPATNSWSTGAPMPGARSLFVSCVINGKIYVAGGWPNSYSDLYVYDPATNTWATKTSMMYGVMQCNSGVSMNGKFYVIGGRYGQTLIDYNQVYDQASNSWTTNAHMPIPVFQGAAAVYRNKIHMLGGGSTWQPEYYNYDIHYVYDPATNNWSSEQNLPLKLCRQSAVSVHDTMYMIGGDGNDATGTVKFVSGGTYAYAPVPQPAGITTIANDKLASFYPNPAVNDVRITLEKNNSAAQKTVSLKDYTGKNIAEMNFSGTTTMLNTSNIPSGIYWLTVTDGAASSTEKLVIMH